MNSKLKIIEEEFIEAVGQLSVSLSINRIVGQLYALLFLSPHPLSLDDMVDKLKISKGNASVNIRELERWGAVRKMWVKGERKNFYEANLDIFKIVTNRLKNGLTERLQKVMGKIERSEGMIRNCLKESSGGEEKIKIKVYQDRIKRVKKLSKEVENLLKILSRLAV